jgi:hypothetical protein
MQSKEVLNRIWSNKMSRVLVNHSEADTFVQQQRTKGIDVSWDGWTMVFWKYNANGFNDKNGAYKRDRLAWGVQARVEVDTDGNYKIPVKYLVTRRKRA